MSPSNPVGTVEKLALLTRSAQGGARHVMMFVLLEQSQFRKNQIKAGKKLLMLKSILKNVFFVERVIMRVQRGQLNYKLLKLNIRENLMNHFGLT